MRTQFPLRKHEALRLNTKDGSLRKIIVGCIKDTINSHPEYNISYNNEFANSLAKRIDGSIKEEFCRLFADRELLNYIEFNRSKAIEIIDKRGSLRKLLYDEMIEHGQ